MNLGKIVAFLRRIERRQGKLDGPNIFSVGFVILFVCALVVLYHTQPASSAAQLIQGDGLLVSEVAGTCEQQDICKDGTFEQVDRNTVSFRSGGKFFGLVGDPTENCPFFSGVPQGISVRVSDGSGILTLSDANASFKGCEVLFMK